MKTPKNAIKLMEPVRHMFCLYSHQLIRVVVLAPHSQISDMFYVAHSGPIREGKNHRWGARFVRCDYIMRESDFLVPMEDVHKNTIKALIRVCEYHIHDIADAESGIRLIQSLATLRSHLK